MDYSSRDTAHKPYRTDLIINYISEQLRLLIANSIMSPYLSNLSDYTSNQRIKISQEVEDYQAYTSAIQILILERLIICNPSFTVDDTNLIRDHYNMIKAANDHKHSLPVNSNFSNNVLNPSIPKNFQVVRVVPYNLFSDDTIGNSTSEWNCFDTWSMNPAAVPLSIANHYLN
ncbi:uncharacterized protein EV154DRAFT_486600 [Mucor mucedo]|uniref:uncharacterized protein n=1 Tax=Mucor mucedo TaxID=29922 RepID=UPI00221EEA17|nr:uncharacterized protein EV154DRAFT_486600 [Mucor mucedo]KAI7875926.1 hypothetical protein EV154DRAFT_486600 [Mucor mucedo]